MKFETKVFLSRQKYYFDLGLSTTALLKYLLAIIGINEAIQGISTLTLIFYGFLYALACYIIGYVMTYYEWVTATIEVQNRLNNFVSEMRDSIKYKELTKKAYAISEIA